MTPNNLLRQAALEDVEFAFQTMEKAFRVYLEPVFGWDESVQREKHRERFSPECYRIITCSGEDVGVLRTYPDDQFQKLSQLFILPEYQGRGLGGSVLKIVLQEARERDLPVRLMVLKNNERAIQFYLRSGFETIDHDDHHFMMEAT